MDNCSGIKERLRKFDWNFQRSASHPIHSIHPYPAKFIPEIPGSLVHHLPIPENTLLLDPFCGSGVALVEAQKAGIESIGIDSNPIACLLSRVKTNALHPDFHSASAEIVQASKAHRPKIGIPEIPNLDHWFKKDIQQALARLIHYIDRVEDPHIADALRFCFSSIVVKVSNQDSDTRYAAVDKPWKKEDVFELFSAAARKLTKAKLNDVANIPAAVINKNSLLLDEKDFKKKIGMIITSPPYPNAYEYWLYHKYRMWWLGHDPIDVKENEIGARAHYFKKNHHTVGDFVQQMEQLFGKFYDLCADNAFICFVIGRSKIHGKIIENEQLIARSGAQKGFRHLITIPRTINAGRKSFNLSHARIKDEYIVVFQK